MFTIMLFVFILNVDENLLFCSRDTRKELNFSMLLILMFYNVISVFKMSLSPNRTLKCIRSNLSYEESTL